MTIMRNTTRLMLLIGGIAAVTSPVLAADPGAPTSYVRLKRAAVVPASARDAQQSLSRLGDAAMEACGASYHSLPQHQDAVRRSECWRDSMSDVVSRIGNPYLTAAYQRRASVEVASNPDRTGIAAR